MDASEIEYNPNCAKCRDYARKDRAGVDDSSLCLWHLKEENYNLREEIERLKNEDAAKDDRMLDMEGRYKKELDTFREVLRKISEWGCNGQCVELIKTKCPCCIATEFLGKMEETNVKSTD